MSKIFDLITTFFDFIYRILLEYSKIVLGLIVIIVSAQVFCRKFLGFSIKWSEEVALLLMVWMAFISMAIGVERKLHIAITLFFNRFPKPAQKFFTAFSNVVICAFGIVLMVFGCLLIKSTMGSTLPATKLPAASLYLMIPVGGLFTTYYSLMDLFHLDRYRHKKLEGDTDED